jgi:hypothetical protein
LLRKTDAGQGDQMGPGPQARYLSAWPQAGAQWRVGAGVLPPAGPDDPPGSLTVAVGEPLPGFATFGAARALLAHLIPVASRESPELLGNVNPEWAWLIADLPGQVRARAAEDAPAGTDDRLTARRISQRVAESIIFAATWRISRESHHSAIQIDGLADLVLQMRQCCPSLRNGLTLAIDRLDKWDRPSLRFLHRVALLAPPGDRIGIVASVGHLPMTDEPPRSWQEWVTHARRRFLDRLAAENGFQLPRLAGCGQAEDVSWPLPDVGRSIPDLLVETCAALGYQNYERAYLLCEFLIDNATDREDQARARRLAAVTHAQQGEVQAAAAELELALGLSADPPYRAHLEYLAGLLATKRHFDLAAATARYQRGERILDDWGKDPPDGGAERAWLWNGQALVLALEARGLPDGKEREALLRRSAQLEVDAYGLVRDAAGAAAAYLRHNLLANITSLLEISHRYGQAAEFWTRAFERFLAADSRAFTVVFDGRLGLLLCKDGSAEEGIAALERARAACRQQLDLFFEERMCLALGCATLSAGRYDRALAVFGDGADLAVRLRDRRAYADHLAGLLWALAEQGDRTAFLSVVEQVRGVPQLDSQFSLVAEATATTASLPGALRHAGLRVPVPPPKMPTYFPAVDLEGIPARDLSRYLVEAAPAPAPDKALSA